MPCERSLREAHVAAGRCTSVFDMPSPLIVTALDTRVAITFDAEVSQQDAARFAAAWEGALAPLDGRGPDASVHVTLGTTQIDGAERFDVAAVGYDDAVASLSTRVTLAAIEHRKSELVMLHACGVALDDGSVLAFVGPSGRGKTTLVSELGRRYAYVTDETVGIDRDGRVNPYRKPLSRVSARGAKVQLSPRSLELVDLPAAELRIRSIALIDRQGEDGGRPEVHPVPLADALTQLVPELSYLPLLEHPLRRLAELVSAAGGVNRITYSEAALIDSKTVDALMNSRHVDSWSPLETGEAERSCAPGSFVRVVPLDGLRIGDVIVLLHDNTVRVVDGIGPAIWDATATPASLPEITRAVIERHGAPDGGEAGDLVADAVHTMTEMGILARG